MGGWASRGGGEGGGGGSASPGMQASGADNNNRKGNVVLIPVDMSMQAETSFDCECDLNII